MAYFTYLNRINYDIKGVAGSPQLTPITNILQRARMKSFFINHVIYFTQYLVNDGETPEIIANEFYGDPDLHWVVLFAQRITNPYYDWPMHYFDLVKYTTKKYEELGGLTGVHHYEDEEKLVVDIWAAGAVPITNIEHEEKINDKKREIDLVRPDQINNIVKEMKNILR